MLFAVSLQEKKKCQQTKHVFYSAMVSIDCPYPIGGSVKKIQKEKRIFFSLTIVDKAQPLMLVIEAAYKVCDLIDSSGNGEKTEDYCIPPSLKNRTVHLQINYCYSSRNNSKLNNGWCTV